MKARALALALGCCLLLAGCRHKVAKPVAIALPPAEPVPVEPVAGPGVVASVPVVMAPVASVKLPKKLKKPKKKVVVAPPVQVASVAAAPVPAMNLVGALSAGGTPERAKQAGDLLASILKRVEALPASVVEVQKEQVTRVKLFWGEANTALKAGDAEGAFTLATKAKVLLDEVK